jgi:hypothetical protein
VPIEAVLIDLGVRPTLRRTGGLPIAALFCIGMIGVGCVAAVSISNTAVAMGTFLCFLIAPILALSALSTFQLRAQRSAAFEELIVSISNLRDSIDSQEVCRRYAEFRQQFDLQFLGFDFAPLSSQPFASDYRRLEAAAGCPLPRVWMLGGTSRWKHSHDFLQKHTAEPASTFRALKSQLNSWRVIGLLAMLMACSIVGGVLALALRRAGFTSSPETIAVLVLPVMAVVFLAGDFLIRRACRRRELCFVAADPPSFEKTAPDGSHAPTLIVDWDDLVCFVADRGQRYWPMNDGFGRPDWRMLSLSHGFVLDLVDLPPIPQPWLESMLRALAQASAD